MVDRIDEQTPLVLAYPFTGRWMARNSPARRIPSHGTHRMGTTYAIDFVGVDEASRSGPYDWRSALASEPPERFIGFGRPILAPIAVTDRGPYVLLAHLRRGSIRVCTGDGVRLGEVVGECGNSGNSIQPHVHVQATESTDWDVTRGLPIRFWREDGKAVLPEESEIVDVCEPIG